MLELIKIATSPLNLGVDKTRPRQLTTKKDHSSPGFIFKLNEVKETRLKYFPAF